MEVQAITILEALVIRLARVDNVSPSFAAEDLEG